MCTCSMGSPTERTISCPIHRPSEGKSAIFDQVTPVPYNPDAMTMEELVTRSDHFVDKGLYPEAIDLLNRIMYLDSSNSEALRLRSICFGALRHYGAALQDAQEYSRRVPDDAYGWLRIADSFYGLRKYDDARKAYIRAGKFSPSSDFSRKVSILFDNAKYRHNAFRCACPGLAQEKKRPPSKADRFSSPNQAYVCNMCLMPHPCKCKLRQRPASRTTLRNAGVFVVPSLSGKCE